MWNEADHPRDDSGRFVEKGGYEGLRERRFSLSLYGRNYSQMPSKKNWQRVVDTLGTEEDVEYLTPTDFSQAFDREKLLQRIGEEKENIQSLKNAEEARRQRMAEERVQAQSAEEQRIQKVVDRIKASTTANDTTAKKLIAVTDRAEEAADKARNAKRQSSGQSGYVGKSKSVRATNAEAEGKFPKTKAALILGVTTMELKSVMAPIEWHHTGALYQASDYYDISDICDIASDLQDETPDYIRQKYSAQSIDTFEKLYGVKIK